MAVAAVAAEMLAHRATYELALAAAEPASGITAISGVLQGELIPDCRELTVNQAVHMVLHQAAGGAVETRFAATVWESNDAREMTFSTRNEVGGEVTEAFTGHARVGPPGLEGRIDYTRPDAMALALPAGVTFPLGLTRAVLAAADRGTRFLSADLFDGGGTAALNSGTVFIGRAFAAGEEVPSQGEAGLAGARSWVTRFAHYSIGGQEPQPLFEVGYRLFENGVITDLNLDYGDFQVSGTLAALETLTPVSC